MTTLNKNRLQFVMRSLRHAAEARGVSGNHRFFGKRLRSYLRGGEEGGALVEFALVAPMMLMLMTGMFSVVMALMNYQQLGSATNNASQVLMTARGNLSDPCATAAATVTGALPTWTATKFTYTVTITDYTGTLHTYGPVTPTSGSPFSCTAGATVLDEGPNGAQGEPASVSVTYQYTWLPLMPGWVSVPALKLSGNLAASSTVLIE